VSPCITHDGGETQRGGRADSIFFGNFAIIINFLLLTSHRNFILLSPLNEGESVDANKM
jgi:hypothetical protein